MTDGAAMRQQAGALMEAALNIAREAGDVVARLQEEIVRDPKRRTVKQDGSYVTDADMRSLECIARRLRALSPSLPVVAEEQPSDVNKTILESGGAFWLVDSLDNTADYALGGNNFSINIALVSEDGWALGGVLVFPGLKEAYFTGPDGFACKQSDNTPAQRLCVIPFQAPSGTLDVAHHPERASGLSFFRGQKLRFITSRGQRRACMVATGDVALCVESEGFYIWDTAPVAAIVAAAGGGVYSLEDGRPLTFRQGLRLPAYAAAAARDIPQRMGLFGADLSAQIPPFSLRKQTGS